jgi:hypothetical protein
MRKCNQNYNAKRGGIFFRNALGKLVRAAHHVAQIVANKGVQLMQNWLLTGVLSRYTWKLRDKWQWDTQGERWLRTYAEQKVFA